MDDPELAWRTASYSGGSGGDCVEVATGDDAVLVRDSKDRPGPRLRVPTPQWQSFTTSVQAGEFS